MKTDAPIEANFYLMSAKPLSFLKYQAVYQLIDGERFLRSINFLKQGKVITKFRLQEMLLFDDKLDINEIIIQLVFRDHNTEQSSISKSSNKKRPGFGKNVDQNARNKAACNLFTSLGI